MGPLKGYKIIEFAGIGPGPFCAMMLADMGADVIRIDRKALHDLPIGEGGARLDVLNRGRRSVMLDLKQGAAREVALRLIDTADALIEGYRPGVMERLGLGPEACMARNPRLVYGRMTGFGQTGPLADRAGHDINYISISGALSVCRRAGERPVPPANYLGDFGGGGMLLAFGILAALLEAGRSGRGQVIDAAMTEGSAILGTMLYGLRAMGAWNAPPGNNLLDTGTPFYDVYQTRDGKHVSVGPLEEKFFDIFLERAGLGDDPAFADRNNRATWPEMRRRLAARMAEKSRDEWEGIFAGTDACVMPVLDLFEAHLHPHNAARGSFFHDDQGILQPSPAPRFSRTMPGRPTPPPEPGADSREILRELGLDDGEIAALFDCGAVTEP